MDELRYLKKYRPEVLHTFVEEYGRSHDLTNALTSLELMRSLSIGDPVKEDIAQHCLMMCRMMIDLNMELTTDEEDVLYASAICHVIPEMAENIDLYDLLVVKNELPPEVYEIVNLVNEKETLSAEDHPEYFEKIKLNKLALLIAVTDQGNVVEKLHSLNSWQVRHYIYDTRHYYFQVCIYAKQHYHELLSPIGILLEKLRNLTDVSEVLLDKYEQMEDDLMKEIDGLKEENGTIKGLLAKLSNEI